MKLNPNFRKKKGGDAHDDVLGLKKQSLDTLFEQVPNAFEKPFEIDKW